MDGTTKKQEDPNMAVGVPILDTFNFGKLSLRLTSNPDPKEETKGQDIDPLLKILVSTMIVDVMNRQISHEEMAQKFSRKGLALRTEQIRDFITANGAP